jgi:ribosomal protein L29
MKTNCHVQTEKPESLKQLFNLRMEMNKIFCTEGPTSPQYIKLSKKLDLLLKKYHEEQLLNLINILKDELIETWVQKGFQHPETIEVSQKLDEVIIRYQKLK